MKRWKGLRAMASEPNTPNPKVPAELRDLPDIRAELGKVGKNPEDVTYFVPYYERHGWLIGCFRWIWFTRFRWLVRLWWWCRFRCTYCGSKFMNDGVIGMMWCPKCDK